MPSAQLLALVDALATAQYGLVTHDQLLVMGFSRSMIRRWLERGFIVRYGVGVVRSPGAPASWHQRVMAASLTTGGLASHRTAAALHRLDGFPPTTVEVVTDRWKRLARSGFLVHETKDLRDNDLDTVGGIPCTSLVRTLIDLPAVCSADHAGLALDHACRKEERVLPAVRQRFLEVARRGRNGTVVVRELFSALGLTPLA